MRKKRNAHKKRDIFFTAFLLMAILICMGWAATGNSFGSRKNQGEISEAAENINNNNLKENQKMISKPMEIPKSYKEELDDQNKIDAVISIPENIREKGFRQAWGQKSFPDRETMLQLFGEYDLYEGEEYKNVEQYRGADNMYLYYPRIEEEGFSAITDFAMLVRSAFRNQVGVPNFNRDKYVKEGNLGNFTLEECREILKELSRDIGMGDSVSMTCYALDYQTMSEEAMLLDMDGNITKPDHRWSDSDNCFYCEISQLCNGIPVISASDVMGAADIIECGEVDCIIKKDRIADLSFSNIYSISYSENYEELLSFDEILQRYRDMLESREMVYQTCITDITMRVLPTADGGDRYKMHPVWVFYGHDSTEVEGELMEGPYAVFFDGVTGDIL